MFKDLNSQIYFYDDKMTVLSCLEPCFKCEGFGVIKEFSYFKNGVCFECNGLGSIVYEVI